MLNKHESGSIKWGITLVLTNIHLEVTAHLHIWKHSLLPIAMSHQSGWMLRGEFEVELQMSVCMNYSESSLPLI